jgi:hypothetical protein
VIPLGRGAPDRQQSTAAAAEEAPVRGATHHIDLARDLPRRGAIAGHVAEAADRGTGDIRSERDGP